MRLVPRLTSLWSSLFHKDTLDRDLDEEIRATVETLAERYVAAGLSTHAAERAALEGEPRGHLFLRVIGRMRPGITVGQARADLDSIAGRITHELGTDRAFTTVTLGADGVREVRGPLLALFVGVAILLMIACVNVSSVLVARAVSRARETALRLSLGASRARLVRQSLVEGLRLTSLGAAAGAFAGFLGLRALVGIAPDSLIPSPIHGTARRSVRSLGSRADVHRSVRCARVLERRPAS